VLFCAEIDLQLIRVNPGKEISPLSEEQKRQVAMFRSGVIHYFVGERPLTGESNSGYWNRRVKGKDPFPTLGGPDKAIRPPEFFSGRQALQTSMNSSAIIRANLSSSMCRLNSFTVMVSFKEFFNESMNALSATRS
jgi:hypothetical protein